ncbi:MAG: hypothetical protein A3D31_14960 [Candidatus Fluviicola riflensis]|nr:MAG: hypothetical protein CHH17_19395 [Candidatus Fluviicola riflensis]OGS78264.1 MAG: hypothetical protein A3D31_14960 [Candidatus Fluviicola riflensis]OGS85330.1 MAG: hypothetical protein A2724_11895 [Fluviicola sp. RIFCSPHIGHO2_01_FULL_43_53]OGS87372.1 MAG: hypothetical protein A3E30_08315 [Fluviicola sp. RIFCSPHIGHO2_12_FULL_43_24]
MIETFPIPIEDLIQDPSLTELDLEDQLNLETEDVDSADAARRKALFQNNFLLNDAVLPENPIKISRAQLEVLYDKVKHFPTNKKCLTGLLIHFASKIESNKYIFYPLFQPVFLRLNGYHDPSQKYTYVPVYKDKVFHFNGIEFVECKKIQTPFLDEELEWKNNYKHKAKIRHSTDLTQPFELFLDGTDSDGQLFTFQLIYALMHDNGNNYFYLRNSMTEFLHDPLISLKHSLILSTDLITANGNFANKYANRSHLCPPCAEFAYTLQS